MADACDAGNDALSNPPHVEEPDGRAVGDHIEVEAQIAAETCNAVLVGYAIWLATTGSGMVMRISRMAAAAVILAAIGLAAIATAPAFAADPFGIWLTGDKKGKVKIVNCAGALCGTLVWLQEPNDPDTNRPKTDKHNVDASKRERPLLGIPIVLGMKASGTPDKWDGKVYNAEDGNTYSGSFTVTSGNTAALKGCVLGGLICKTQTWMRTN